MFEFRVLYPLQIREILINFIFKTLLCYELGFYYHFFVFLCVRTWDIYLIMYLEFTVKLFIAELRERTESKFMTAKMTQYHGSLTNYRDEILLI